MKIALKQISICVAAFIGIGTPLISSATVLQFENAVPDGQDLFNQNIYVEANYTMELGISGFISPTSSDALMYGPASSSDFLSLCGCSSGVSIHRMDGQLFTLSSVDVGIGNLADSAFVRLSGRRADFTVFNYDIEFMDHQWHSLSFAQSSDFENLLNLTIGPISVGNFYSIAIDNVNLSPVPLPATAWLFGSGLLGLAGLRRK